MGDWPAEQSNREADTIVRRRQGRRALASLVVAALIAAAATACALPLRDLGPLPPRYSGPPLAADTVVSEMTSVLAAEGITVERQPSDVLGSHSERLSGLHAPQTVDGALKAAFERARSEHGWQTGPDMGSGTLTLVKGNWTALASFPGEAAQGLQALVIVSLTCIDCGDAAPAPTGHPSAPTRQQLSPTASILEPKREP
ncbi:hypothetical protein [Streptomyces cirratus]|nr:hypothetical protein [Streptomyces cirratus]